MVLTVLDSKISLIPSASDLETLFLSGTPIVLSVESMGFTLDETQELLAFDVQVQVSGSRKKVFWLYDHETSSFVDSSLNTQVATQLEMAPDDINLTAVALSGDLNSTDAYFAYSINGENQTKLGSLKSDGSFIADHIEAITGEIAHQEITNLDVRGPFIIVETADVLRQLTDGASVDFADEVLDDNQSSDIYVLDTINNTVKFVSQLAGQALSTNSSIHNIRQTTKFSVDLEPYLKGFTNGTVCI